MVKETNDHPLQRQSGLISSTDREHSLSSIMPLLADQERFPSEVKAFDPLTVINSIGGKDCVENDKYVENVNVSD